MTDGERLELALRALKGGACWLGVSIKRGTTEYVACYQPRVYAAPDTIEESYHSDPWECLKLGLEFLSKRAEG